MQSQRIKILIFLSIFISCAPRYPAFVPELKEIPSNPYGSFIKIKLKNGDTISGELIAVSNDSVFVYRLSLRKFEVLDIREIEFAKIVIYRKQYALIIIWGLLGTLSTITHGLAAIITAPSWCLGTLIALGIHASEQNEVVYPYPNKDFKYLAKFSRYPQGLPPDLKKKILEEEKLR